MTQHADHLELVQLGLKLTWCVFMFAFGACVGSLINVLVYRLPRGLGVVTPTSRCPACDTKLTWRENIPVIGWLALAGRCRFCKSKISAEYPLVEAFCGALFVLIFSIYYILPDQAVWMGIDWGLLKPSWAAPDSWMGWPATTWPVLVVHLILMSSLVAMTLVDAKTFTIPLVLAWTPTVVGVVGHTFGALMIELSGSGQWRTPAPGSAWSIPTPGWPTSAGEFTSSGWWWIGASLGGMAGLGLSILLVKFRLIRRSFEDYAEWEQKALADMQAAKSTPATDAAADPENIVDTGIPVGEHVGPGVRLVLVFVFSWLATILVLGVLGTFLAGPLGWPQWAGVAAGAVVGPFVAGLACGRFAPAKALPEDQDLPGGDPTMWIAYPHARREMIKEVLYLTPCIGLAMLGGWLGVQWGGGGGGDGVGLVARPPLWLLVLCGSLMGYLLGGAVVWGIRIGGSLAFGKEAMGLGDVHLMAAVGACIGWVNAALALPLAAVVGLWFVVVSALARRPAGRAMPFGPYLAVATVLIWFGRPLVEKGLSAMLHATVRLP